MELDTEALQSNFYSFNHHLVRPLHMLAESNFIVHLLWVNNTVNTGTLSISPDS